MHGQGKARTIPWLKDAVWMRLKLVIVYMANEEIIYLSRLEESKILGRWA